MLSGWDTPTNIWMMPERRLSNIAKTLEIHYPKSRMVEMVQWWKCTECDKPVDEFEKTFDLEKKDGRKLCSECRKPKKEYRYSQKVLFREGDKMRVSGGPYYPSKSGKKIKMGLSGVHTFSHIDEQGCIWVRSKEGTLKMMYMGKPHLSNVTGTYMQPHKLRKVRKKK